MSAEAVALALLEHSSITSLCGGKAWLARLPQGWELPGLVYSIVSVTPEPVVAYQVGAQRARARVQVTMIAADADDIVAMRAAVRVQLDFVHQVTRGGHLVVSSRLESCGPLVADAETGAFMQTADYMVMFYE